jgi:hypothetical protein
MTDYNDNRLKQDSVERAKKSNGSVGMAIAAVIIIGGIILAIYFYNRPAVEVTVQETPATQQSAPATTAEPAVSQ